jgi:hypothetical protein
LFKFAVELDVEPFDAGLRPLLFVADSADVATELLQGARLFGFDLVDVFLFGEDAGGGL